MQNEGIGQSADTEHYYRPDWRTPRFLLTWTAYFVFAACVHYLLSGLPFFGTVRPRSIGGSLVWAIIFTAFMGISWGHRISLTVDARGVIYRTGYATIMAGWRDVERIGPWHWPSPTAWGEGLVLRPGTVRLPWWNRSPGLGGRFIPLGVFDPRWREGAIGDDICRYAPWLLDGNSGG
jgi:hypothetical protein